MRFIVFLLCLLSLTISLGVLEGFAISEVNYVALANHFNITLNVWLVKALPFIATSFLALLYGGCILFLVDFLSIKSMEVYSKK